MVIVYMYVCVICRTLCVIPRTLFLFCLLKYHLIAEIVQTVQRAWELSILFRECTNDLIFFSNKNVFISFLKLSPSFIVSTKKVS